MSLKALTEELEARIEQLDSRRAGLLAKTAGDRDWAAATVPELKAELKAKGLPVSGKKHELVARLMRYGGQYDAAEDREWFRAQAGELADRIAAAFRSVDAPNLADPQALADAMLSFRNSLAELLSRPDHVVPLEDVQRITEETVKVAVATLTDTEATLQDARKVVTDQPENPSDGPWHGVNPKAVVRYAVGQEESDRNDAQVAALGEIADGNSAELTEPKHKQVTGRGLVRGRQLTIYGSAANGAAVLWEEGLGVEVTDEDLERGWVDVEMDQRFDEVAQ